MIHGGDDTYIKPHMARAPFQRVKGPREFWLVEGAKHNQALSIAGIEYEQRVRAFFDAHLGQVSAAQDRGTSPVRPPLDFLPSPSKRGREVGGEGAGLSPPQPLSPEAISSSPRLRFGGDGLGEVGR